MAKIKDKLFARKRHRVGDFNFGKKTAVVFDDMLGRSVPFYAEMQRMMGEMAADFAEPGTSVYDLGCSTCTTFLALDRAVKKEVLFVGVDSSPDMLSQARKKLSQRRMGHKVQLVCADLNKGIDVENASVVILNLTLQFVRPLYRHRLIRRVAGGIRKGGCLILIEKVLSKNSTLNRLFINYYHLFKERNGYSRMEISQKREALENVLIPYRVEENMEMLLNNGFSACEIFFKWYNFYGIIALK